MKGFEMREGMCGRDTVELRESECLRAFVADVLEQGALQAKPFKEYLCQLIRAFIFIAW